MEKNDIICGLDIGTTKIAAIVGKLDEEGNLNVVGVGTHPSHGLRRGVVVNIEKTVNSIKQAVQQAELTSGHRITRVFAGIAGDHIRSLNSKGVIAVSGKDKIITKRDVGRVLDAAQNISLPKDRKILHVLPQEFTVDNQDGIKNPVGFAGTLLEAEVHIITGAITAIKNIINCIEEAGYEVGNNIVLEPYASSLSVLHDDERDLGVAIIDIGGGTTDIAIFFDGAIRFTKVLGIGGEQVTNDLAQGLRTSKEQAEEIKKKYGLAMQSMLQRDELISVPGVAGRLPREISRSVVAAIVEPRMEEIFQLALKYMERSEAFDSLGAGVVLTGGASLIEGTKELAQRVFGMPVEVGIPRVSGGLVETVRSPVSATGVGLLYYAIKHGDQGGGGKIWSELLIRVKKMVEDMFG
ncbi:cell division protein FtsA [Caldithrix abyssi]